MATLAQVTMHQYLDHLSGKKKKMTKKPLIILKNGEKLGCIAAYDWISDEDIPEITIRAIQTLFPNIAKSYKYPSKTEVTDLNLFLYDKIGFAIDTEEENWHIHSKLPNIGDITIPIAPPKNPDKIQYYCHEITINPAINRDIHYEYVDDEDVTSSIDGTFADAVDMGLDAITKELAKDVRHIKLRSPASLDFGIDTIPNLEQVTAKNGKIWDFTGFPTSTPKLTKISVENNKIGNIADLPTIPSLETLNLSHNSLIDLVEMHSQPKLKELDLSHNEINTLQGMPDLPNLEQLNLAHNQLSDLSGLRRLEKLRTLNLHENNLTNFWGMPKFKQRPYPMIDYIVKNPEYGLTTFYGIPAEDYIAFLRTNGARLLKNHDKSLKKEFKQSIIDCLQEMEHNPSDSLASYSKCHYKPHKIKD